MYSTAPHGDVRREIAHNAPPLVFHKKWNSNYISFWIIFIFQFISQPLPVGEPL